MFNLFAWLRRKREARTAAARLERQVRVDFNEQCISATYPDGRVESIAWTAVVRITIETNDRGPWDTDV